MRTLSPKERNDLFFQYLLLFVITVAIFLLGLFSTQEESTSPVSDQEKAQFNEYETFQKAEPQIIQLIDSIKTSTDKLLGGSTNASADLIVRHLIKDLDKYKTNSKLNDPYIDNISFALTKNVEAVMNTTSCNNKSFTAEKNLQACINKKERKESNEDLQATMQAQSQSPSQTGKP